MFSKKPKIKSISSTTSGEFLFVFGVGRDNKLYIWNSEMCVWLLYKAAPQPAPEAPKNV